MFHIGSAERILGRGKEHKREERGVGVQARAAHHPAQMSAGTDVLRFGEAHGYYKGVTALTECGHVAVVSLDGCTLRSLSQSLYPVAVLAELCVLVSTESPFFPWHAAQIQVLDAKSLRRLVAGLDKKVRAVWVLACTDHLS